MDETVNRQNAVTCLKCGERTHFVGTTGRHYEIERYICDCGAERRIDLSGSVVGVDEYDMHYRRALGELGASAESPEAGR